MQQILIEVSHQDQVFVENECTNKGLNFNSFFKLMLEQYKEGTSVPVKKEYKEPVEDEKHEEEPLNEEEKPKAKRGRKKKGE